MSQSEQEWLLKHSAPPSLAELVEPRIVGPDAVFAQLASAGMATITHMLINDLPVWCDARMVVDFLSDPSQVENLLLNVEEAALGVGMSCQGMHSHMGIHPYTIFVHPCLGCNTVYEVSVDTCLHPHSAPRRGMPLTPSNLPLLHNVHKFQALASLICSLLRWPGKDASAAELEGVELLLDKLAIEAPAGVSPARFIISEVQAGRNPLIVQLVGIVDNCHNAFPQCAHTAVALLSLIVARRPAASLCLLDPQPVIDSLYEYLGALSPRVMNAECIVEEHFGIIQLMNAAPLLYFLGDWKESLRVLSRTVLPSAVASIVCNIIHSATKSDAHRTDRSPDLEELPEMVNARLLVARLFGEEHARLIQSRPMSAAAGLLIEILGRWAHCGIPVREGLIPTSNPRERCTVAMSLEEYMPRLKKLTVRLPIIEYCLPIAEAIIENRKPSLPTNGLLRSFVLHNWVKCGLQRCRASTCADGKQLKRCSGGCRGLARYCSPEHQKEHWKKHKFFCKRS